MFSFLFFLLVRTVAIPVATIFFLQNVAGLDRQVAFMAVCVIYSLLTIPLILWHGIKILPNLALIRVKSTLKLVVEVVVELASVIGIWIVYLLTFHA